MSSRSQEIKLTVWEEEGPTPIENKSNVLNGKAYTQPKTNRHRLRSPLSECSPDHCMFGHIPRRLIVRIKSASLIPPFRPEVGVREGLRLVTRTAECGRRDRSSVVRVRLGVGSKERERTWMLTRAVRDASRREIECGPSRQGSSYKEAVDHSFRTSVSCVFRSWEGKDERW